MELTEQSPAPQNLWNQKMTDEEHRVWIRRRRLEQQRERRAHLRRIDYYVSADAAIVIDRNRWDGPGGDISSVINRALVAWSNAEFPEYSRVK